MPPPGSENSFLGIEAKYKDLDQWFSTIPAAVSRSRQYIQATLKTQYPEVSGSKTFQSNANIKSYRVFD
jgi:bifunctional pyridoxal-dependent enzyme with beta-cystathionase and maltose regulon repressor activities